MRRWYSSFSLRLKATAVTLAITTLSLTIMATTGIIQIHRQVDAEQHRSANAVATSISRGAELAMTERDKRGLSHLANSFLRDPNVLFIAIYGSNGQQLTEAVRDRAAWNEFLEGKVDTERCVVGKCSVTPAPIGLSSDQNAAAPEKMVGRIFVGLSTQESIEAQIHLSRLMAVAAVAAGLGAAGILFSILGPWIRRLQRLAAASQSISQGNFSGMIGDQQDDEIGRLGQSFEKMCAALRERDTRLRDFTETLREQVAQRTKDLELALSTAEEANRAKSMFLANMSHELRTPLNGVIGMVDLLLAAEPTAQQRRYCDIAKSSGRALLELINDILDFSKIEAGKLELDATDFDLQEMIEGTAQMLGERAEKKNIELVCSVRSGVPRMVNGDPVRLRQVIVNLIANAIKFTQSGEVVLDVQPQEETETHTVIRFSVRDTGIGIPQDRLDRLFKSFSQLDASTTRKFGGTGLGLAISQRLVEMMDGRIAVESQEGKGSTFWFTVKLVKRAQIPLVRRQTSVDMRGLRVLAVDDNHANCEILQTQLSSWSLRADIAGSAKDGLELLRAAARAGDPYHLAILDINMPDIDGLEMARQIKADPVTRDAILLSLSSICTTMKPRELQELGFAASLTKPALSSQLYNTIVDALAAHSRSGPQIERVIESPASRLRITGVRILLAEDNEVNQMVASELLSQSGCVCTIVVNGREAVAEALRNDYHVILMDCQMPELDGFEATHKIREAEKAAVPARHRPIIALTANAIKGDREKCLAAGMDGYVTKPIEPLELLMAIRCWLPKELIAQIDAAEEPQKDVETRSGQVQMAAPAIPEGPPVDLESLARRCMGNRQLAAKALNKFESSMAQEFSSLVSSVRDGNATSTAAVAHKIKGAAANVSVEEVRRVAGELEKLAKTDEMSQMQDCLAQLDCEMGRFRSYLSTALAELAVPVSGGSPKGVTPKVVRL